MFKNISNAQWIWFSGVHVLMSDFFPASSCFTATGEGSLSLQEQFLAQHAFTKQPFLRLPLSQSLLNIKGQLKVIFCFSDKNYRLVLNGNLVEIENGLLSIKGINGSGKTTYLLGYQSCIGGLYFNPAYRLSWPDCEDRERLS